MINGLIQKIQKKERRAIARAMSLLENGAPEARELLQSLYRHTGNAYRIGITGPPGAGKSTLTARMINLLRQEGKKIGVVAVDPTSPFSGGAVLGDRVRMSRFANDPEVFIRSMASRGSMGGLAHRAQDVADVLDAAGKDYIIFETVGVGQTELDIAEAADTTVVVLVPESGDAIQAMKAGLMEIAEVFVVNKSDREGANRLKMDLSLMLQLRIETHRKWTPPIVSTTASRGEGVEELLRQIAAHREFLETNGLLKERRKSRMEHKIKNLVSQELEERFWTEDREKLLQKNLTAVLSGKMSPFGLVEVLFKQASPKK